jgi:glycosyltransferase involved in cell wall biosynthesis
MNNTGGSLARMGIKAAFLVWGPPSGSQRSDFMGGQLGTAVQRICFTAKRGRRIAPIKYFSQTLMTLAWLVRHRYQLIFVQDPPIFAVLPVYCYSLLSKAHFIIDSHTDALQAPFWEWTLPLHRFLDRRAIITIVTNDHLREMIESWGGHGFTLQDPPAEFEILKPRKLPESTLNIVVVSTADYDEPIDEILQAARDVPSVDFYITGDFTRSPRHVTIVDSAPDNVHFTGYLHEGYFDLLAAADVIMCLSTEDNTFLSGANEALWLGKPLITSDWPLLREYFLKGAIHVDNTAEGIRRAITTMRDDLSGFEADMRALQRTRRQEWWERATDLLQIIQKAVLERASVVTDNDRR